MKGLHKARRMPAKASDGLPPGAFVLFEDATDAPVPLPHRPS